jgi:hypothetical protein
VSYAARTAPVHADADGAAGDDGPDGDGDAIQTDVERLTGGAGDDVPGAARPLE